MSEESTQSELSPGIYIDLKVPATVYINPAAVLRAANMEVTEAFKLDTFATLEAQYIEAGYAVILINEILESDHD